MINIAPYIDKRNSALWEELNNSNLHISIEYSKEQCYSCYLKNESVTIYVTHYPNTASFTHELLHTKLFKDKVLASSHLKNLILHSDILNRIIKTPTLDVLTNCMEHIKMLPMFLSMGYKNEEFIEDYYDPKIKWWEFFLIEFCYKIGYKRYTFDRIIGKFIAMKADNNPSHNYDKYFTKLSKLVPDLYETIETFWTAWLNFDICHKEDNDDLSFLDDFSEESRQFIDKLEILFANNSNH